MKVKTSITLSKDVLNEIDDIIAPDGNRSIFIEDAVKTYIKLQKRILRNQNDLKIINKSAKDLNKEAKDILSYQVKIWKEVIYIGFIKDQNMIQKNIVFLLSLADRL